MEWTEGNHQYLNHLYQMDYEHEEYLRGLEEEAQRRLLEENQGKIEALEDDRAALAEQRGLLEEAKALYESYTVENEQDRPADYSEDRLEEVEFAFFNLEAHVRELQKELEKVEGLKQAVDDALAAQQEKFNMDLQMYRDNRAFYED